MRFLLRGTTALACATLASTAFLTPATAAPAQFPALGPTSLGTSSLSTASLSTSFLGTTAAQQFTLRPFSPAIPSQEDIDKAKKSESTTATASAQLEAILSQANDKLAASTVAAMGANSAYTAALVTVDQREAEAATAQGKANEAAGAQKSAKAQLGKLAGSLYKNGGLDLSVQSFLTSSDADDAIYQATTRVALSTNRAHTFDTAEAAAATLEALGAQALAARNAANEAATAAEASHAHAQSTADAQAAVVAENKAQRDVLLQRLAALHNTTVSLEGARVDELARKAQEAALQQQIADSSNASVPTPPNTSPKPPAALTPAGLVRPVNPALPPAAPAPLPPAPKPLPPAVQPPPPPVVQAPQPPAPVAPPVVNPPPAPPVAAPPAAPPTPVAPPTGSYTQVMVNYAMSKVGGPYQWGGNGPVAFDCSGLVQQAFAAAGISVPRQGSDQFWAAPVRVPLSQMRYGDLLVFDGDGNGRFGHIAIYIGNNQVVQALNPWQPIGVTPLSWMSTMSLYPYAARY